MNSKSAIANVVASYRREGLSMGQAVREAQEWQQRMDGYASAIKAAQEARDGRSDHSTVNDGQET